MYKSRALTLRLSAIWKQQNLLSILQELPDGYKAVFNLYAVEGYSHREVGENTGE